MGLRTSVTKLVWKCYHLNVSFYMVYDAVRTRVYVSTWSVPKISLYLAPSCWVFARGFSFSAVHTETCGTTCTNNCMFLHFNRFGVSSPVLHCVQYRAIMVEFLVAKFKFWVTSYFELNKQKSNLLFELPSAVIIHFDDMYAVRQGLAYNLYLMM
jgi:hypothetical protein